MKISQEAITGAHQIRDYGDGFLLIQHANGQMQRLSGNFILGSEQLLTPTAAITEHFPDLSAIKQLNQLEHDVLIVVTSPRINAETAQLMQQSRRAGLSAEFMALGPACRTFNLLLAEGRKPLIWASL
jgi:uncharacterized protein